MLNLTDVIVAIATPRGEGGVAIVRLSGSGCETILRALVERPRHLSDSWQPRHMYLGRVVDSQKSALDEVLAVFMPAPHSYTGENVAEIHCHGGFLLPSLIVDRCVELGARLAEPGEFTLRAFLNGKLDLAQAEAVLGLIQASSAAAVRLQAQGLEGALSQRVKCLRSRLLNLVARLEAEIDFGEEVDSVSAEEQSSEADGVSRDIYLLLNDARNGDVLAQGVNVALSGPPNAGKSTLWNKLLGEERALVTPIPGTTRDRLEAGCTVNGCYLHLIDTAGLHQSADYVEQLGMQRTREAIEKAELNVVILDGSSAWNRENEELVSLMAGTDPLILLNKRDLGVKLSESEAAGHFGAAAGSVLSVSLLDDGDLPLIKQRLSERIRAVTDKYGEGVVSINQRQMQALNRASAALQNYRQGVAMAMPSDCLLSDLHRALGCLGEVTGENVSEDILDRVFSAFCLGK